MGISRKNKPLQAATNQNIKNNRLQFTTDFKMHSSIIISIFLTLIAVSSANYCRPLNSDSIKVHRYLHQLHSDIKTSLISEFGDLDLNTHLPESFVHEIAFCKCNKSKFSAISVKQFKTTLLVKHFLTPSMSTKFAKKLLVNSRACSS